MQRLRNDHGGTTDVATVGVSGDTYLFFNGAGIGAAIDSVIKLAPFSPA